MSDEKWWDEGPIFSAQDRGGKITSLAPGERVRPFSLGLLVLMLFAAATWTVLVVLWLPRGLQYGRPAAMVDAAVGWTGTALLFGALLAMLVGTYATYAVAHRLFHQVGIAWVSAALPAAGGVFAGCWLDGIRVSASVGEGVFPDGTIQLIFMGVAATALVGLLIWMPFAIARALRRSRLITGLRQNGRRYEGEVVTIGRPDGTLLGLNQFRKGEVAFDGGRRRVEVAMATDHTRVPLPAFPVVVYTGLRDAIHVDPDPARPWNFDPDTAKYYSSADGGGG